MEDSEYERQRQENIARNKALLRQLQLDSLSASLTADKKTPTKAAKPKARSTTPRAKKERVESPAPRRTSSRLAGLPADSAIAKRKAEDEHKALEEAERAKRARIGGDLSFEIKEGLLDGAGKYDRTFTEEDVKKTGDKSLREVREKMMNLKIWEEFDPTVLKVVPERIYHLGFHPTPEKPLIFASDKVGNLGILNAASTGSDEPDISTYKLHARSISTFVIPPSSPENLYTASYDGTIRKLDLNSGKSIELFVHPDESGLSSVHLLDQSSQTLLFSTLEGEVGRYDLRTPNKSAEIWQCSDKKIGGCDVMPSNPDIFATASLDRTVKIWDIRKITNSLPRLIGEHTSRLSVSSAVWSSTGKLATTSYDDTVKIYNPTIPSTIKSEVKRESSSEPEGPQIEPTVVIKHNNQTGRWVTILRAQWQEHPEDGVQKLVIANMNRCIDVYGEDGSQLAQLQGEGVTAVPAAARAHPKRSWVAGGTASGKIVLFV